MGLPVASLPNVRATGKPLQYVLFLGPLPQEALMPQRSRFAILFVLSSLVAIALAVSMRAAAIAQDAITVHLPVVNLPATVVDTVVAQGRVTLDGVPLANAPFELWTCDGEESHLLASSVTDEAGAYQVLLPIADPATSLSAMLVYPATGVPPARGSLATFTSICVSSFGVSLSLPNIELEAADWVSPGKGGAIDMPILFAWEPRTHPGIEEMYQVVGSLLYDCSNCAPIEIAAAALPFPSASVLLECVYSSRRDVTSAEFRVMVSNASGVGYSDSYAFNVGHTQRCTD